MGVLGDIGFKKGDRVFSITGETNIGVQELVKNQHGTVNGEQYEGYCSVKFDNNLLIYVPSNSLLLSSDVVHIEDIPDVRDFNVGDSNYAQHKIQPWDIWEEYDLNPWDADIVKRVLRTKKSQSRKMDYEKIIHICQKRISQIDKEVDKE